MSDKIFKEVADWCDKCNVSLGASGKLSTILEPYVAERGALEAQVKVGNFTGDELRVLRTAMQHYTETCRRYVEHLSKRDTPATDLMAAREASKEADDVSGKLNKQGIRH